MFIFLAKPDSLLFVETLAPPRMINTHTILSLINALCALKMPPTGRLLHRYKIMTDVKSKMTNISSLYSPYVR